MLAYMPTTATNTLRKIPRKNVPKNATGFDRILVGFAINADTERPVTRTAIIPATIAQAIVQRSITKPRPNAKPQPTMSRASGLLDI